MSPISVNASCQAQHLQLILNSFAMSSLPPHPVHSPLTPLLRSLDFSTVSPLLHLGLHHLSFRPQQQPCLCFLFPVFCFHLSWRLQPEGVSMMFIAYRSPVPIPPHFSLTLGFFVMAYKAFLTWPCQSLTPDYFQALFSSLPKVLPVSFFWPKLISSVCNHRPRLLNHQSLYLFWMSD